MDSETADQYSQKEIRAPPKSKPTKPIKRLPPQLASEIMKTKPVPKQKQAPPTAAVILRQISEKGHKWICPAPQKKIATTDNDVPPKQSAPARSICPCSPKQTGAKKNVATDKDVPQKSPVWLEKLGQNYSKIGRNQVRLIQNDRNRSKRVFELESQIEALRQLIQSNIHDESDASSETDSESDSESDSSPESSESSA